VSALVRVTIVADELEAEMVCALLRTDGIEATHRRTDFAAGAADASTTAAGPREVVVPLQQIHAARELLGAAPLGGGEFGL
jgi:hypothetical protein